jgi:hypothetical protein
VVGMPSEQRLALVERITSAAGVKGRHLTPMQAG